MAEMTSYKHAISFSWKCEKTHGVGIICEKFYENRLICLATALQNDDYWIC